MTKKQINVPVGAEIEIGNYDHSTRQYLRYKYRRTIYVNSSSVEELIKLLQKIKSEYGNDYTNLCIESIRDCGCYHDCQCSPTLFIQGTRLENDVEHKFRLADEKQQSDLRIERDRTEYERLKKEFKGE